MHWTQRLPVTGKLDASDYLRQQGVCVGNSTRTVPWQILQLKSPRLRTLSIRMRGSI